MDRADIALKNRRVMYDGKVTVLELLAEAPRFAGGGLASMKREVVQRVDSVAALVHDVEKNEVALVEQVRLPVYEAGGATLLEFIAGKIDAGETPEAALRREMREELGYRAGEVRPLLSYYCAPGYSTERVHLFYAPVRAADLIDPNASGVDEGEDIRRVALPMAEFLDRLRKGAFTDGKIFAAGAWALENLGQPPLG